MTIPIPHLCHPLERQTRVENGKNLSLPILPRRKLTKIRQWYVCLAQLNARSAVYIENRFLFSRRLSVQGGAQDTSVASFYQRPFMQSLPNSVAGQMYIARVSRFDVHYVGPYSLGCVMARDIKGRFDS